MSKTENIHNAAMSFTSLGLPPDHSGNHTPPTPFAPQPFGE